ncbi:MAG: hypothetical protein NTZ19_07530, partial [Bacteroidetes bacterium]|nr:hypothetical protein [Bacteroidota bacterium]
MKIFDAVHRMYDPQIRRFHAIDTLADESNNYSLYIFASDNPILIACILLFYQKLKNINSIKKNIFSMKKNKLFFLAPLSFFILSGINIICFIVSVFFKIGFTNSDQLKIYLVYPFLYAALVFFILLFAKKHTIWLLPSLFGISYILSVYPSNS